MNAERLLAHYERIADAPDAIARLRRFVLDLAVRGKLVLQDGNDEPASELLSRIGKKKTQQVKEGKAKRSAELLEPNLDQAPFELPAGWAWGRFPELGAFGRGKSKHRPRNDPALFDGGTHLMIQTGDVARSKGVIETYTSKYNDRGLSQSFKWPKGTLCITIAANIADSGILSFEACFPDSVVGFIPASVFENARYFEYFIRTAKANLLEFAPATAQKNINLEILTQVLIPLPPLAEQHRIVVKIDELMALCDRLEAARAAREATRDQLAAASLARLNSPNPDTFQNDARFALNTLPALTTRPDQIKQLRETILNLAVRGRLVPQDPNDEPASDLIKRVLAQPWSKKRKLSELLPDEDAAGLVFPLPTGWTWATVDLLVRPNETVTYGILKPEWVKNGVPTVRVTEMKTGVIDVASLPQCDVSRASKFKKTTLVPGDLLISKDGTIGKTAFVPPELAGGNITQHVLRFPITEGVCRQFIRLAIDAPFCQSWMAGETKGVALQGVNVGDFRRMPIPLPPLAEQHRIVAKVDELTALCDRLEANLTTTDDTRRRLLEALLAEALAPDDARELEAAE
jgi:type I restriction enzyme S subunit